MNVTLYCDYCNKPFQTWSAWAKKYKHHYCSKKCKGKHRSILNIKNPDYFKNYYQKNRDKKLEKGKEYYKEHKKLKKEYDCLRRSFKQDELNAYDKERYYKFRRISVRTILGRAKQRAKKLNIPFDLKEEDVILPEMCPVFGFKLNFNFGSGGKFDSPSLDRIIPKKGYVKGNVIIISNKANSIKNNASYEEILKVGNWLRDITKGHTRWK